MVVTRRFESGSGSRAGAGQDGPGLTEYWVREIIPEGVASIVHEQILRCLDLSRPI